MVLWISRGATQSPTRSIGHALNSEDSLSSRKRSSLERRPIIGTTQSIPSIHSSSPGTRKYLSQPVGIAGAEDRRDFHSMIADLEKHGVRTETDAFDRGPTVKECSVAALDVFTDQGHARQ